MHARKGTVMCHTQSGELFQVSLWVYSFLKLPTLKDLPTTDTRSRNFVLLLAHVLHTGFAWAHLQIFSSDVCHLSVFSSFWLFLIAEASGVAYFSIRRGWSFDKFVCIHIHNYYRLRRRYVSLSAALYNYSKDLRDPQHVVSDCLKWRVWFFMALLGYWHCGLLCFGGLGANK